MKKFFIIGTMGSGKSTLARKISQRIGSKQYSLDDIYWTTKYTRERNKKSRAKLVKRIIKSDKWVIEGVFSSWVREIARKADIVVWLDMSKYFVSKNILKRYIKNKIFRREQERGGFLDIWKTLVHARKYKTGEHKNSYKGHKEMIDKTKAKYIRITNTRELKDFERELK